MRVVNVGLGKTIRSLSRPCRPMTVAGLPVSVAMVAESADGDASWQWWRAQAPSTIRRISCQRWRAISSSRRTRRVPSGGSMSMTFGGYLFSSRVGSLPISRTFTCELRDLAMTKAVSIVFLAVIFESSGTKI